MKSGKKIIKAMLFHSSDSITRSHKLQLGNTCLSYSGELTSPVFNSNGTSNTPSSVTKLTIFNLDSYIQSNNQANQDDPYSMSDKRNDELTKSFLLKKRRSAEVIDNIKQKIMRKSTHEAKVTDFRNIVAEKEDNFQSGQGLRSSTLTL